MKNEAYPFYMNSDKRCKDNLDILDFTLTDEEIAAVGKLNKGVRYYNGTEEQLAGYARWQPTYETA